MTLPELIQRVKDLAALDLDLFPSTSDEGILTLLNEAQDEASLYVQAYLPQVSLTLLQSVAKYPMEGASFARRVYRIDAVRIGGTLIPETPLRMIEEFTPDWRTLSDPSTPIGWFVDGERSLTLYPPPDATAAASGASVAGRVFFPTITVDSGCQFPTSLHPALARLAVAIGVEDSAGEPEQLARAASNRRRSIATLEGYGGASVADNGPDLNGRARSTFVRF